MPHVYCSRWIIKPTQMVLYRNARRYLEMLVQRCDLVHKG